MMVISATVVLFNTLLYTVSYYDILLMFDDKLLTTLYSIISLPSSLRFTLTVAFYGSIDWNVSWIWPENFTKFLSYISDFNKIMQNMLLWFTFSIACSSNWKMYEVLAWSCKFSTENLGYLPQFSSTKNCSTINNLFLGINTYDYCIHTKFVMQSFRNFKLHFSTILVCICSAYRYSALI